MKGNVKCFEPEKLADMDREDGGGRPHRRGGGRYRGGDYGDLRGARGGFEEGDNGDGIGGGGYNIPPIDRR